MGLLKGNLMAFCVYALNEARQKYGRQIKSGIMKNLISDI